MKYEYVRVHPATEQALNAYGEEGFYFVFMDLGGCVVMERAVAELQPVNASTCAEAVSAVRAALEGGGS